MKDEIVAEVRKVRYQIEREYNKDTDKYLNHVYKAQKKHGSLLVCRKPKLIKKRQVA